MRLYFRKAIVATLWENGFQGARVEIWILFEVHVAIWVERKLTRSKAAMVQVVAGDQVLDIFDDRGDKITCWIGCGKWKKFVEDDSKVRDLNNWKDGVIIYAVGNTGHGASFGEKIRISALDMLSWRCLLDI